LHPPQEAGRSRSLEQRKLCRLTAPVLQKCSIRFHKVWYKLPVCRLNRKDKLVTSENASLSATSFVHWKNRVNWRVNLKTATGTVVTLASCPANLSHNVITWRINKHLKYPTSEWSNELYHRLKRSNDAYPMEIDLIDLQTFWTSYVINFLQKGSRNQFITSWVVQARGPANVKSFLAAFSFRIAINVSRATSYNFTIKNVSIESWRTSIER
jgi:hypothetical protein